MKKALAILILILPFMSVEAAGIQDLGRINCTHVLGGGGTCQNVEAIVNLGLNAIKTILKCNPNEGQCSAVQNQRYLVKVDAKDTESCMVFHYFVTARAFNKPAIGHYLILADDEYSYAESCDHRHECPSGGLDK